MPPAPRTVSRPFSRGALILTDGEAQAGGVGPPRVHGGQPVGSRWLSEETGMPWKPSTIRAELARLEELGLLQHPHTSAGRVPT